ncbi:hypothetical protein LguiB_016636 [Lonicera macranthoides]
MPRRKPHQSKTPEPKQKEENPVVPKPEKSKPKRPSPTPSVMSNETLDINKCSRAQLKSLLAQALSSKLSQENNSSDEDEEAKPVESDSRTILHCSFSLPSHYQEIEPLIGNAFERQREASNHFQIIVRSIFKSMDRISAANERIRQLEGQYADIHESVRQLKETRETATGSNTNWR